MRTFLILLLLANLVYLGWNLANPPPPEPVLVREPARAAENTLTLVSELPETVEPEPELAPGCISVGVFDSTEEGDFLVAALLERGLDARVELLPSEESVSYRVYIPPFNSDTAARQMLARLQADNIDSFMITTGQYTGGISLGLFSQEELASGLQSDLAAQGFATSIQQISTPINAIWVTITGLSQGLLEGSELLDLLTAGLELDVIEKPCETFASDQ